MEDRPLVDSSGDLWVSRRWVREIAPDLRPAEFLYLVWKEAGLPVSKLGMSERSRIRIRHSLRGKGLL